MSVKLTDTIHLPSRSCHGYVLDIGPLCQASRRTHRSRSLSAASPKISRSALGKIQSLLSAVENDLSRQSESALGLGPWSFEILKGSKDFSQSSNF